MGSPRPVLEQSGDGGPGAPPAPLTPRLRDAVATYSAAPGGSPDAVRKWLEANHITSLLVLEILADEFGEQDPETDPPRPEAGFFDHALDMAEQAYLAVRHVAKIRRKHATAGLEEAEPRRAVESCARCQKRGSAPGSARAQAQNSRETKKAWMRTSMDRN